MSTTQQRTRSDNAGVVPVVSPITVTHRLANECMSAGQRAHELAQVRMWCGAIKVSEGHTLTSSLHHAVLARSPRTTWTNKAPKQT